jgi:uncharacterized protein (DUF1330 family)
MAAYLIVDTLLDNVGLHEEYKLKARPLIESFGGEYLARGGRMTLRETDLWSPARLVLIRFPDMETANRCLTLASIGKSFRLARNQLVEPRLSWKVSRRTEVGGRYRWFYRTGHYSNND